MHFETNRCVTCDAQYCSSRVGRLNVFLQSAREYETEKSQGNKVSRSVITTLKLIRNIPYKFLLNLRCGELSSRKAQKSFCLELFYPN